ncbi:thioredoxin domain-containing protein [Pallidibacillus pasinlerensis]|uniref:Thioredoxin domain-containing protein n=1 Tax=Pallidibacillus pasinlerensis TaxID=2703818 RepID=A0ABX0A6C7_9BACI|nr:thioredoxin domain-containing protein [Pallidibacillus pasinlerensis]NCU19033.1 thioredoxin domain-containing protein [Pallidibacillus pasinlerensis]
MNNQQKPNRLIHEKSPYLLQHAYNPVDWYPWGEEAFEKAKEENKPIFLSIGYSTCHWCHVMERESFENEEIAKLLNERFISIKVDREERPDIDSIYMLVCQMMTGHGGWPLSIFMTPDKIPFYAGTYFPRESRYGMPGFKEIIINLYNQYKNNPEQIKNVSRQVTEALKKTQEKQSGKALNEETLHRAFRLLKSSFDQTYGGFGEAPKFPMPHNLSYLLMYAKFYENDEALQMATKTLDALADGGIYDHIGFGFARYSTDDKFLVPHFEKMLYDNALLTIAYTEAYQLTKEPRYKKIAEEIITYVTRDMQHIEGGFYSAEDADSEGEEGRFYVWSPDEIKEVLGEQLGSLFCEVYDVTDEGNFEGKSIPNLIGKNLSEIAEQKGIDETHLIDDLENARKVLFLAREKRVHPFKDDKILTSWNGLMIAAIAQAARAFDNDRYIEKAERAIKFIEENLFKDGRLMVRYRDGEVKQKAFLDDYAYLLWGYVELYRTTFKIEYLASAKYLANSMIELFWDKENGGFFFNGHDDEKLLINQKDSYDGALPSGNSVATLQLLRLAKLTGDYTFDEKVQQIFDTFASDISEYPQGHSMMLQAFLLTRQKMKEVVLIQPEKYKIENELIQLIQKEYNPHIHLLVGTKFNDVVPFAKDYKMIDQKPTVYVCENFHCNQPTNDFAIALKSISED